MKLLDLYRGINDFMTAYRPRTKILKDGRDDLFTVSHSIFARWRNCFSQLLNIHGVNGVRQTEIHTAQPILPEPSTFDFEMAIEKLKRGKSPVLIKSQQNWLKQKVEQFAIRSINLLILSGIRRNCLRSGRSRSLYLSIRRVIRQTVVTADAHHFCQLRGLEF